ncbi:DUF397 domain-containing protein [Streptomonospora litoralis]|uniref:DUF397 domain-containing protein n=1 Tax=Streptomonospora litoralis TaxID=2498135 RepID=A0A4P6PUY1_9ACTN|nr:DUF397 domain-containing protein [Streptomonospora litoralis]QBI51865.1 hypothetical protein EKD16_00190 [Streptomonospora litoralis]
MTEELHFHKSSYSVGGREDCVEVAKAPGTAAVRDTQNRHLGHVEFPAAEWDAFLEEVKADRL